MHLAWSSCCLISTIFLIRQIQSIQSHMTVTNLQLQSLMNFKKLRALGCGISSNIDVSLVADSGLSHFVNHAWSTTLYIFLVCGYTLHSFFVSCFIVLSNTSTSSSASEALHLTQTLLYVLNRSVLGCTK
jgi:hypothetical protein